MPNSNPAENPVLEHTGGRRTASASSEPLTSRGQRALARDATRESTFLLQRREELVRSKQEREALLATQDPKSPEASTSRVDIDRLNANLRNIALQLSVFRAPSSAIGPAARAASGTHPGTDRNKCSDVLTWLALTSIR